MNDKYGAYAFIGAVLIALIASVITLDPAIIWLSLLLGVIVGLLNVKESESTAIMIASIIIGLGLTVLQLPSFLGPLVLALKNIGAVALAVGITTGFVTFVNKARN